MAEPLDFDKVKDFIESYAIHRHLYNMPPDVRKRFSKKMESKDYSGHHKYWPAYLENVDQDPPQFPSLTSEDLYEELYSMFQAAFENMSENRSDLEKDGKEDTTLAFLDKWYGDGKLFEPQKLSETAKKRLEHFVTNVLDNPTYKTPLSIILQRYMPEGTKYNDFVRDLKDEDKRKKPAVRDALKDIVEYVQYYSNPAYNHGDTDTWPSGLAQYDFTRSMGTDAPAVDKDATKWFIGGYNPAFKHRLPELFDKLVSSGTVFKDFTKYDNSSSHQKKGIISEKIQSGLDFTAWDKTDSDDYVKPKDDDEKTIWQRFEKAKDDFVENHINPWFDMLRSRRRFFSPYARAIIEACGKAKTKDGKKIKPTDGLQGILDNKDAILKKLGDDPKGKPASHFDWVIKKLAVYADTYTKAFAGAFKNPRQMKKIVSRFIIDGLKESKVAQVKTALEMLSVMKYGMFSSKTMQDLKKAEFIFLSDKGASWNKYEATQMFTKVFDKTLKYASLGIGYGVAALRNKWFRAHTKFRGKTKFLDKAHDKWKKDNKREDFDANVRAGLEEDWNRSMAEKRRLQGELRIRGRDNDLSRAKTNVENRMNNNISLKNTAETRRNDLQEKLAELEQQQLADRDIVTHLGNDIQNLNSKININQTKISGLDPVADKDQIDILRYEIMQFEAERDSKQDLLRDLGNIGSLRNDIQTEENNITNYENAINDDKKLLDDNEKAYNDAKGLYHQVREVRNMSEDWESGHGDNYMKLMAYWDMLETYGKSHQNPWFRSMKDVRDEFTEGFDQDKDTAPVSQAKIVEVEFWNKYKQRHAA